MFSSSESCKQEEHQEFWIILGNEDISRVLGFYLQEFTWTEIFMNIVAGGNNSFTV